jgi:hypothetical protein
MEEIGLTKTARHGMGEQLWLATFYGGGLILQGKTTHESSPEQQQIT